MEKGNKESYKRSKGKRRSEPSQKAVLAQKLKKKGKKKRAKKKKRKREAKQNDFLFLFLLSFC